MSDGIKIGLIIGLVLLLLCVGPMLFLWSVNSLAELGGSGFYIGHSIWSYFVTLVFLAIVKAGINTK